MASKIVDATEINNYAQQKVAYINRLLTKACNNDHTLKTDSILNNASKHNSLQGTIHDLIHTKDYQRKTKDNILVYHKYFVADKYLHNKFDFLYLQNITKLHPNFKMMQNRLENIGTLNLNQPSKFGATNVETGSRAMSDFINEEKSFNQEYYHHIRRIPIHPITYENNSQEYKSRKFAQPHYEQVSKALTNPNVQSNSATLSQYPDIASSATLTNMSGMANLIRSSFDSTVYPQRNNSLATSSAEFELDSMYKALNSAPNTAIFNMNAEVSNFAPLNHSQINSHVASASVINQSRLSTLSHNQVRSRSKMTYKNYLSKQIDTIYNYSQQHPWKANTVPSKLFRYHKKAMITLGVADQHYYDNAIAKQFGKTIHAPNGLYPIADATANGLTGNPKQDTITPKKLQHTITDFKYSTMPVLQSEDLKDITQGNNDDMYATTNSNWKETDYSRYGTPDKTFNNEYNDVATSKNNNYGKFFDKYPRYATRMNIYSGNQAKQHLSNLVSMINGDVLNGDYGSLADTAKKQMKVYRQKYQAVDPNKAYTGENINSMAKPKALHKKALLQNISYLAPKGSLSKNPLAKVQKELNGISKSAITKHQYQHSFAKNLDKSKSTIKTKHTNALNNQHLSKAQRLSYKHGLHR